MQCLHLNCTHTPQFQCALCNVATYCSETCAAADFEKHHKQEHAQALLYQWMGEEALETEINQDADVLEMQDEMDASVFQNTTPAELIEARRKRTKKWIQKTHMKEGAFTAQAKRHHMTTRQFMRHVLAHPEKYSTTTVRRANLMRTLLKLK